MKQVQKYIKKTGIKKDLKIGLIALYDLNSFAIRILHSVLSTNNFKVESLFFKCENPNNTMDKPTEVELQSLVDFIKEKGFTIVGISVRSSILSLAWEISNRLRKLENAPTIIFGGVEATLAPEKCISYADIICIGEGEKALLQICKGKNLKDINNIYYKQEGKVMKNHTGMVEENLNSIPFADFSDDDKWFVNADKIIPLKTKKYKTRYSLMTSRGCPFNCAYCCNNALRRIYHGKYLRRRSVDNVIAELIKAKKEFPELHFISFLDDVFTFDKKWIKDFAIKYKKFIDLPFFCYTHASMCDEEVIKDLRYAGLSFTTMGVQSFSERIRKESYFRQENNDQIVRCSKIFHKYGIHFVFDIIMDNPIETEKDLAINLDWLFKIKPPFELHTHTLTYFPNTQLTTEFINKGFIKKEDVEDEIEKGWERWTPALDLKRDNLNLLYDCLFHLACSRYRSEWLIRKFQHSLYFRNNPQKLAKFIRLFNYDVLGLNWNSRLDRAKFFISQGFQSLIQGEFSFLFLKIKQQLKDPEIVNV